LKVVRTQLNTLEVYNETVQKLFDVTTVYILQTENLKTAYRE